MEHITIKTLSNGLFRLIPETGYLLFNIFTGKYHSEVETRSTAQWKAIADGTIPTPHIRTLEEAKIEKISQLISYDSSSCVNSFSIAGNSLWIAPDERANYMLTIEGAKRNGITTVTFLGVTIPVDNAIAMLDAVNLYAMRCVEVTNTHKERINSLLTIDEVDAYDFTVGYPEKLSF